MGKVSTTHLLSLDMVVTESFYIPPIDRFIHNHGLLMTERPLIEEDPSHSASSDLSSKNLQILDSGTVH